MAHASSISFASLFMACFVAVSIAAPAPTLAAGVADWPQVQGNAQHTGFSSESVSSALTVLWTHPFQPEKIYPQVQAIVGQGLVFVGTEMGNLYAFDVETGNQRWVFVAKAPIVNSVAYDGGRVYFGAMNGAVYGVDAATGAQVWRTKASPRLGFSTAPVIADGKVMLGGRNGMFYAFDPANGTVVWQTKIGAPILQTAAADSGRVFFGAMNLRVIALNTVDGSVAWQSEPLPAMAFKDYWPVVVQGTLIERPTGAGDLLSVDMSKAGQRRTLLEADGADTSSETLHKSLYLFDAATGAPKPNVIHSDAITMNGAAAPPCVDKDGLLIMSMPLAQNPSFFGWGRLSLSTRQFEGALIDARPTTEPPPLGFGNIDENMAVTCAANAVLAMHTQEANAQFTGIYDYAAQTWTRIEPGHASRQLSSNTQGGGANPAAIAGGKVFHISWHELIVRGGGQ